MMKVYLVVSYDDGVISGHSSYGKAEAERKWLDAESIHYFHGTYIYEIILKD